MKHKVSELEGALLDAAVAKAVQRQHKLGADGAIWIKSGRSNDPGKWDEQFEPSTDWSRGGPILERERICLDWGGNEWVAAFQAGAQTADNTVSGPTPLIAAMRAYVASKFGDEVELP